MEKREVIREFSGNLATQKDLHDCVGLFRIERRYFSAHTNEQRMVSYELGYGACEDGDSYRFVNPAVSDVPIITVDAYGHGSWLDVICFPGVHYIDEDTFNRICELNKNDRVTVAIDATLCELVWFKREVSVFAIGDGGEGNG